MKTLLMSFVNLFKIKNLIKKLTNKSIYSILIFAFIFAYIIIILLYPFVRYNNLLTWDMAGLFFSSWYTSEFLFPRIIGWNPFFFLGFPQNQFYPPLFPYLTSLFSTIMPITWAFKLVFSAVLILTPLSFYHCARSFKFSKNKSALAMLVLFSILFIFNQPKYGGEMYSTFNVGLVAHAMGLTLLFFYIAELNKSFKTGKYLLSSFLLASIILSHVIMAITAVIGFVAFFVSHILSFINTENVKSSIISSIKFIIKHIILTFLLTAFWVIPFLSKMNYTDASLVDYQFTKFIWLIFSLLFLLLLFMIIKKKNDVIPIALFMFFILIFTYIGSNIILVPLHYYRMTSVFVLLFAFIIIYFFGNENKLDKYKLYYLFISILCIFVILTATSIYPHGLAIKNKIVDMPEDISGRILVAIPFERQTAPHILQHQISLDYGAYAVKGLYVESSKHARYIFNLERAINKNNAFYWGVTVDDPFNFTSEEKMETLLPYHFNLFNINSVVLSSQDKKLWPVIIPISFFHIWNFENVKLDRFDYNLYNVSNSEIIEVLDYIPRRSNTSNWQSETINWFLTDSIRKGILVDEEIPDFVGNGNETVEIIEMEKSQEYIKFKVNSDSPVPILIKISEFPNWRVYQNGVRQKIYRASPYLMLTYGYGEMELKYEPLLIDIISNLLTIIGIIIFIILLNPFNLTDKFILKIKKVNKKLSRKVDKK